MSKRMTRVLSLILTLVMFVSVSTPAFAWGGGDLGSGWDRDIGEDEIRDFDEPVVEEEEPYDYFQTLEEDSGTQVTVEAPMGSLPTLAELRVETVEAEDIREAVESVVEGEANILVALDISFWLNGVEIEPDEAVRVKISAPELDGRDNLTLVHIPDADEPETIDLIDDEDLSFALGTNEIAFEANSFSVYVVVGHDEYARATVEFYNSNDGTTPYDYMIVKEGDTLAELEKILYDPGAGTVPEGKMFVGWSYNKPDYTVTDRRMNIAAVRQFIFDETIVNGKVYKFYSMIFDTYTFNYLDETGGVSVGAVSIPVAAEQTDPVDLKVEMAYTPSSNTLTFLGWAVLTSDVSRIVSAIYNGEDVKTKETVTIDDKEYYLYQNGTELKVTGSLDFRAYSPEGHWLIFEQNGSGATYCAPQFVKKGEVTRRPRPNNEMLRYGYTFNEWYTGKPAAVGQDPTGEVFKFGYQITEDTTVYAKWDPNARAPYTIFIYQQNAENPDQYDMAASYTGIGTVGQPIGSYSTFDFGDEDYLQITGEAAEKYHYKGFNVKRNDAGEYLDKEGNVIDAPIVVPEGTTTVSLYYDRIVYTLKFYIYRDSGSGNQRYSYGLNSGSGSTVADIATWQTSSNHPSMIDGLDILSERIGNYTYYYYPIVARYGQNISAQWPTYDKFVLDPEHTDRVPVSYIMMVGTKQKPNPTTGGSGTVKGVMQNLDENNLLGKTEDADGNYLVVRFNTTVNNWINQMWFETIEGEDYSGYETRTLNGKTYYHDHDMATRSSNTNVSSQNPPVFTGFKHITKTNQNWTATGNDNNLSWYDNNTRIHYINQVYDREKYTITYQDCIYVDGNNNQLATSKTELGKSSEIPQGAHIPEKWKNFKPTLPEGKEGYVFEGWYADEACTQKCDFDRMPAYNMTVYAKWRQIEYRLFLDPQVPVEDTSLEWGSESQKMNFRIAYDGKASLPTGLREEYDFLGWYSDKACTQLFSQDAYKLNEDTVPETPAYDKENDFTDGIVGGQIKDMNKYGKIEGEGYNSDLHGWDDDNNKETPGVDRYWITRKLVLYADWRAKIPGALGIQLEYVLGEHATSAAPKDNKFYLDKSDAVAAPAPTAAEGWSFRYWVVQKWDETENDYVDTNVTINAGDTFKVLKSDSHITDITYEDDGTTIKSATYTVRVRAEFVPLGNAEPTHIYWYSNLKSIQGEELLQGRFTKPEEAEYIDGKGWMIGSENLMINEAVAIEPATTYAYPGATFLGWARVDNSKTATEVTEADLFLKWDATQSKFFAKDEAGEWTIEATEVACDEKDPYQDLYALWDLVGEFYVFHSSDGTVDIVDMAEMKRNNQTTYDLTEDVKDGYLYGGYFKAYLNVKPEDAIAVAGKDTAATTFTYDATKLYVKDSAVNSGKATMYWTKANAYTQIVEKTGGGIGTGMTPVKGQVYYLREVPEAFLGLRVQVIYDWNDNFNINNLFLITTVDNSVYSEAGFKVKTDDNKAAFYASYSIQSRNSESATVIKAKDINNIGGYVGVWDGFDKLIKGAAANSEFTVTPYWITMDDVRVEDTHPSRTFNIGNKTLHAETKDGDFHEVFATTEP